MKQTLLTLTLAVAALFATPAYADKPATPAMNPHLAQSYNQQTHWNDAATDSVAFPVARGSFELTPEALQFVANESIGLPSGQRSGFTKRPMKKRFVTQTMWVASVGRCRPMGLPPRSAPRLLPHHGASPLSTDLRSVIELFARRRETGWPAHAFRGQRLKDTETVSRKADRRGGEIGGP